MPTYPVNEKDQAEALARRAYIKREDAAVAVTNGEQVQYLHHGEWVDINPYFHTIAVFQFAPAFRLKPKQ